MHETAVSITLLILFVLKLFERKKDIMALQDSNCALSAFAVVATETSGQVNVLHPLEWGNLFNN